MRIGLITTIDTNIGDTLIREGICMVLREVFKGVDIEFVLVNKHEPLTVYPNWHPVHLVNVTHHLPRGRTRASRLIERFASKFGLSRFDRCDLIVQCGAPVLWPGCHRCEWAEPLWHHVIGRLSQRIPVLNLAAGSCYPWERQPTCITDADDVRYLRAVMSYCGLVTVRDRLAQHLLASLDLESQLIPCSALLAAGDCEANNHHDGMVLIDYMHGGGHYQWDQGIDPEVWYETVRTLIGRLRPRHRLGFLCHDEAEYKLAGQVDPTLPRLWPRTPEEYFVLVSEVKGAVCNRMHASVALASLGIPSIAVCTDTRLLMVEPLGLPCLYVKDATPEKLEDQLENLLAHRHRERERLLALRSETWRQYVDVLGEAVG